MARKKRSPPSSPISIGNCKLEIDGDRCSCEPIDEGFLISVVKGTKIKISVDDSRKSCDVSLQFNVTGNKCFPLEEYSFAIVNPKDEESSNKILLQEVLKIYAEQLPAMNYAANTGKETHFLEKCIAGGKYRTLILKSDNGNGMGNVIAAVSYQIIPVDTQFAEIPLAAVVSNYQNKGIGHLIYTELKERLQRVGISTILCWADKASEGFWFKQDFISIGEVNRKGKARRLPIKASIRRALCFPGGSTLMVAYLNKYNVATVNSSVSVKKDEPCPNFNQIESTEPQHFVQRGCSLDSQKNKGSSAPHTNENCNKTGVHLEVIENCWNSSRKNSFSSQRGKRRAWEASVSSLKSKRIRGSHSIDDCQDIQDLDSDNVRETGTAFKGCSLGTSGCQAPVEILPKDPCEGRLLGHLNADLIQQGNCPRIMFMNIADDAKKTCLAKIVEELGASVTCNGSSSTHVITGKARRTLNFCIALCSGAWIVSPNWLKGSFRQGKFVGESPFILEDEDYLLKYKFELKDAVARAKLNPNSLLRGYNLCIAKHIQPSADVLSAIIKAAGGNVICKLEGIKEPVRTIFLACEEDMEDAMVAAKMGAWTFSSDWFMSCVMKQDLDMEAPQFTESL